MAEGIWSILCGNLECSYEIQENCNSSLLAIFNPYSCLNHILVMFVDVLLLFLYVFVFFYNQSPRKKAVAARSQYSLVLPTLSAICNGSLGLAYLGLGIWRIQENLRSKQSLLPLHDWLVLPFQGFMWLTIALTLTLSLRRHQLVPTNAVKISLILTFVFTTFLCSSSLWEAILHGETSPKNVVDMLTFPGAAFFLLFVFNFTKQNETDAKNGMTLYAPLQSREDDAASETCTDEDVTPFAAAGILSKFTFWWLNPLLKKGKEKVLEDKDIPKLRREDRAEVCHSIFMEKLMKHREENSDGEPSILSTLFIWQWKELVITGFFALIKVLALATGPLLLRAFIRVSQGKESFKHEGYALAVGLFLAKFIESLSERQLYFRNRLMGLQVKSMLCAAIYQKQLCLSNAAKTTYSAGEIMNYATVDANRIGEFPYWFHQFWSISLQISLGILIVYYSVGLETLAALLVVICTVLLNVPLGKLQHGYITELMVAQDRRLKAISEAFTNMKVLRLYAWETHFKNTTEELRKEELKWLSATVSQRGGYLAIFWMSPALVAIATFLTCYLLGIPLSVSNAFTFLATIRIIQEPTRLIPDLAAICIEAKVALARTVKFLEAPELQKRNPKGKNHVNELQRSIIMNTTKISWNIDSSKPTLSNINFEIMAGEKVAICGKVGSGKSTLVAAILEEVPHIDGAVHVYGKVAYVSQTAWIQTGTNRDNILLGALMDEEKYQEVIAKCSLVKDVEMLPYGDQTILGERGVNLSGGQKLLRVTTDSSQSF